MSSEQSNEKFNTATLHSNKTADKKEENLADDGTGKVQVRLDLLSTGQRLVRASDNQVHVLGLENTYMKLSVFTVSIVQLVVRGSDFTVSVFMLIIIT